MNNINLKDLAYFNQLATTRSFTQTAAYFTVSQPTITQALKRLEARFALPLLERKQHSKSIQLTAAGEALQETAASMLAQWAASVQTIDRMRDAKVRIGIGPSISERYLVALMRRVRQAGVLANIEIVEMGSRALAEQLQAGQVDMVITGMLGRDFDPDLITTTLMPLHFAVLANAAHPLAQRAQVSVEELAKYPFVTLNGDYLNQEVFQTAFGGITRQVLFETENPRVVLQAIAANIALGFLADLTPIAEPAIQRIPIVDALPVHARIVLQALRDQPHSALFTTISNLIVAEFSQSK
ncbi:LysR family transcriptional regulator [Lacticaseibacillus jixiensis]|uniref:LysR family transcriptional regulator n=1 Tax=Lacticaseibacillus jixiensis TaxID=3231926 RepID=UPI0036F31BDF